MRWLGSKGSETYLMMMLGWSSSAYGSALHDRLRQARRRSEPRRGLPGGRAKLDSAAPEAA